MPRGTDMDSVVVKEQRQSFRIKDVVNLLEYPTANGKPVWVTIRLFGPVYSKADFWVRSDPKDPKKKFPKQVRCYDPETHQIVADKYDPFYDYMRQESDENKKPEDRLIQYGRKFYMQAIVRKLQDRMPAKNPMTATEKKTHIKEMDSDSYTPVVVVAMTNKVFKAIQDFKEDNVVKLKDGQRKAFSVNHPKFGRDIMIRYDGSQGVAPGDRYSVKLVVDGKRTPLTEEEKSYLQWNMEAIYAEEESEEEIKRDFNSWFKRMGLGKKRQLVDSDEDTEELEDVKPKKVKKVESDYDEDESDDFEDDDFDEKPKAKKKIKKVVEEDLDDEDDDFDSSDDEEDVFEEPKKKPKKVKKQVEDDDLDEDDLDEDDFDEPKKKPKKSKKQVEEDPDDDDPDDSDW